MSSAIEKSSVSLAGPAPIFVQAMWRTGSTYVWNKFRIDKANRAYMEPLHEFLHVLPEQTLREFLPVEGSAAMRHPRIEQFCFEEYPLRSTGGLEGFQKYFPFQGYCLDPAASDPLLERYIRSLLELAWANHQRPVLQFNRGLLRAGWLAGRFPSKTILVLRNLFDTWRSFLSFDNVYFPAVICMIVGQNAEDPMVAGIAERHVVPCFLAQRIGEEFQFYVEFAKAQLERLYPVFYELCVVANLHALQYADAVMDMNELTVNPAARILLSRQLHGLGIELSLEDCSIPAYEPSSPEDRRWLASEKASRAALRSQRLRAGAPRASATLEGVSLYWRNIFEQFSD